MYNNLTGSGMQSTVVEGSQAAIPSDRGPHITWKVDLRECVCPKVKSKMTAYEALLHGCHLNQELIAGEQYLNFQYSQAAGGTKRTCLLTISRGNLNFRFILYL